MRRLFSLILLFVSASAWPQSLIEIDRAIPEDAFYAALDENWTPDQAELSFQRGQILRRGGSFFSLGFQDRPVWVTFRVRNREAGKLHLLLKTAVLDHVELFEKTESGWQKSAQGDTLPVSVRGKFLEPHFVFNFRTGEEKRILIKIRTESATVFSPAFFTDSELFWEVQSEGAWISTYLGLLAAMILYNLFIFFSTRDFSYLIYTVYVGFMWVFQACNFGVMGLYLLPEFPGFVNAMYPLSAGFLILTSLHFTYLFHNIGSRFPLLKRAYFVAMAAAAVNIPLAFLFSNRLNNALSLLLSACIFGTAIYSYIRGYRPARYFLIAWTGFVGLTVVWSLAVRGTFESYLSFRYAFSVGSALEVVLFSLALGDRIRLLSEDKEKALTDQVTLKTRLLDSFARFVPREFLRTLGKESPEDVGIGDSTARELTILFSDIRGFTALSEKMNVDQNFRFLNSYLRRMEPIIEKHGGFVDKYIGDAIMAIFLDGPGHALRCAGEMLEQLSVFNEERAARSYPPVFIGIGIHTGPVMLGTVGSNKRMETTVIGDAVNLASRIESLTKHFGEPLLFSETAASGLNSPQKDEIKKIARVRVKGKTIPILIYGMKKMSVSSTSEIRTDAVLDSLL